MAELVISILATVRLGAVAVPFPIQHRAHELRHGFDTADIGLVVTAARPDRPDQIATISSIMAELIPDAPLDPWMVAGWQDKGIEIVNVFGSNEGAAMLSTMASVPDPKQRARFFPRPDREGVEVRLIDHHQRWHECLGRRG